MERTFRRPSPTIALSARFIRICITISGALLVKADRVTMAHSLEARSPLDHELLELAARLPPRWKVRGTTTNGSGAIFLRLLPEKIARAASWLQRAAGALVRRPLTGRATSCAPTARLRRLKNPRSINL
jgi:asparagine synthetase B (glutamine-hydrolysing)